MELVLRDGDVLPEPGGGEDTVDDQIASEARRTECLLVEGVANCETGKDVVDHLESRMGARVSGFILDEDETPAPGVPGEVVVTEAYICAEEKDRTATISAVGRRVVGENSVAASFGVEADIGAAVGGMFPDTSME